MRLRTSRSSLAVAALATLGLAACTSAGRTRVPSGMVGGRSSVALRSCPHDVRRLGTVALAATGRLEFVDLATCRARVLANVNAGKVRFSPDGRWVAYSRLVDYTLTGLQVVPVHGGQVRAPLGNGIIAWSWAPKGALLYGLTRRGSLVAASPSGRRRVIATRLGTSLYPAELAVSPSGDRVAVEVERPRCPSGALVTINVHAGARRVVVSQPGGSLALAGFTPDGRWLLFWEDFQCSASLAADGSALEAVLATGGQPVAAVTHMLHYRDFLSWCGRALIAATGPDRETQTGGALVKTTPPAWRPRTIQPRARSAGSHPDAPRPRACWPRPPGRTTRRSASGSSTARSGFCALTASRYSA